MRVNRIVVRVSFGVEVEDGIRERRPCRGMGEVDKRKRQRKRKGGGGHFENRGFSGKSNYKVEFVPKT